MIHIDVSHTDLRPDGLRIDPISGCLLAPPSRIQRDPKQPRKIFDPKEMEDLRADIDDWRDRGRGPCGTGFLEPLKCRWQPGAFVNGVAKKGAKLILWDGERRWRMTKDDYDWLPVVFDDLSEKEARDAALRTSIHKKLLSRIEEAHAFSEKMAAEGWGVGRLAKHYHTSEGYIKNRLPLIEMPPELQKLVNDDPLTMSHALVLDGNKDKIDKDDLIEFVREVRHGLSVANLKEEVEEYLGHAKSVEDTRHAPDRETATRTVAHNNHGGGQMSRGRQLKGAPRIEAKSMINEAASEVERHLMTVKAWLPYLNTIDRKTAIQRLQQAMETLHE